MVASGRVWPAPNGGDPHAPHWLSRDPSQPIPPLGPYAWQIAVSGARRLVRRVEQARRTDQMSLADLSGASGLPLSSVRATISGASWPMFSTAAQLAAAVGIRVQPLWRAATSRADAGLVACWTPPPPPGWPAPPDRDGPWPVFVAQLSWLADAYDVRPVPWARAAGVRPATVSELFGPNPTRTDARLDTMIGLSWAVGALLGTAPAAKPYKPLWDSPHDL